MNWFKDKGHLVISNGPFYLERYDPPAQYAELRANRDPSYPYKPGDWNFGTPPTIEIGKATSERVTAGRTANVEISVDGPGVLGLKYLLVDPATRSVVAEGDARSFGGRDSFLITLTRRITGDLFPGLYQLVLVAYSDALAVVSERIIDLEVE